MSGRPTGSGARDLTGERFERLTCLSRAASRGYRSYWNVRCACGATKEVSQSVLVGGKAKSCGCLASETRKISATTHGFNRTPTYVCWSNMRSRCSNPKNTAFHNYGGRGITVCERWHDFENFLADMGKKPAGLTIERNDVNGNYGPENCCWAPQSVQDNNKRTTVYVTLDGKRLSVSQAADSIGAPYERVRWAAKRYGDEWLQFVRAAAQIGAKP